MSVITYVIHDVGPAFESDALKDGQHGQSKVVEVCDAEVRTDPVKVTELIESQRTVVTLATRPCWLFGYFT